MNQRMEIAWHEGAKNSRPQEQQPLVPQIQLQFLQAVDKSITLEAWGASLPLTHIGHAWHYLKFEDRNKAVNSVTN